MVIRLADYVETRIDERLAHFGRRVEQRVAGRLHTRVTGHLLVDERQVRRLDRRFNLRIDRLKIVARVRLARVEHRRMLHIVARAEQRNLLRRRRCGRNTCFPAFLPRRRRLRSGAPRARKRQLHAGICQQQGRAEHNHHGDRDNPQQKGPAAAAAPSALPAALPRLFVPISLPHFPDPSLFHPAKRTCIAFDRFAVSFLV